MMFETQSGPTQKTVLIEEGEVLAKAVPEILHDLKDEGIYLTGSGDWQVQCNGVQLDKHTLLRDQGVEANEVLRVSTIAIGA